ncbi:MAG: hypothetical protein OXU50_05200 [Gammaproteobacteria bacterium]|nr:hypothetical protein [Gammaproteobacteria bacterium]
MENNEMDESRIKQIVKEAIAPLSTKVDALEADVRRLVYWTIGTSLTTIVVAMGLVGFAISVFGNHMQSMQLLISALQLPAAN